MQMIVEGELARFDAAIAELVKLYQFRDREETVAYGLSVSQAYALRTLAESGPLAMGALAAALGLSVSAATRSVDALVERRLVERRASAEDRRVRRVALAPRGRTLWRKLHRELLAMERRVLAGLSAAERRTVVAVLHRLVSATRAWREENRRPVAARR
jgi:MarR family 2-MHQ and catechol resistance regulon transcriptional repressor